MLHQLHKKFSVLLSVSVLSLGACSTLPTASTASENEESRQVLEQKVEILERELAELKAEPQIDPLFQTYQTLKSINASSAHQVSALSYVQGNYGPSVNVYPLEARKAAIESVLLPRTEQYPRHLQQLGQDVYTKELSENILVYPLDDPYSSFRNDPSSTVDVTANLAPVSRQYLSEIKTSKKKGRRLTGY